MREFTPVMLRSFGSIDPNHPKYALLASVGDSFILDEHNKGRNSDQLASNKT